MDESISARIRLYCNLDMLNALIAVIVSFFSPGIAFMLLLSKLPLIVIARIYLGNRNKRLPENTNKP